MALLIIFGIALLGVTVAGSLWLRRKAFYRRNHAGIEEFSTYGESLKIRFKEGVIGFGLGLCALAGIISIFIGGIALTK